MPKRNDIKKILVIGSGPIVIGQAAEFDYAGTQACIALKEEGYEVVLINSNPATIMTDTKIADKVYMEPLTTEFVARIIRKERPDAILPTLGGQTGLNLAVKLAKKGILEECNVEFLGTSVENIEKAEDREKFKNLCLEINEPVLESYTSNTIEEALLHARTIGYPVIIRPAFTLGGTGGGFAYNDEELRIICKNALKLSPVSQILIEKSIKGFKEIEYEVMRDSNNTAITICNMENIDPVGVHTGDSMVVCPSQTLTNREYQMLRDSAHKIIRALDIEGGCNVQFALDPFSFDYYVIEVNPRVSRSSALASKASGYPIARVSAKIAIGYNLHEIDIANTKASFEPTLDYIVTKIARFPFDKFNDVKNTLSTQMKATGEVMSIGRTFTESFLKAIRSLEINTYHIEKSKYNDVSTDDLLISIKESTDDRIYQIAELLRRNQLVEKLNDLTGIDDFFIRKIKSIIDFEENIKDNPLDLPTLRKAKKIGFSDIYIAEKWGVSEYEVFDIRQSNNIFPVYKMIDTCASEFDSYVPYFYSSYEEENESIVSKKESIIVLGSGPIRIGQGIEFDYSTVQSIWAIQEKGYEAIVINNNPETISTDYTISDKLYFEPLVYEDVMNIIELEKPLGVIVSLGGQTALNLTNSLSNAGVNIIGTSPKGIKLAENREDFEEIMEELNLNRPIGKAVISINEGIIVANQIGYPVLIRPSYVLGGRGMEIVYNQDELQKYLTEAVAINKDQPVLIDKYIIGKEVEVDAVCDLENIFIPGIMEHIEKTGVHSGDSISVYPTFSISDKVIEEIIDYTKKLGIRIGIKGLFNIQFIVDNQDKLYVIEVNPRSSRTIPFISKVTNINMADLSTKVMLGEKLSDLGLTGLLPKRNKYYVKAPKFSYSKILGLDAVLSPEMKSTGEAIGYDYELNRALYKALKATDMKIQNYGTLFVTICDKDKDSALPIIKRFYNLGFNIEATRGTAEFLKEHNVKTRIKRKISEGSNEIIESLQKGHITYVLNTLSKTRKSNNDGLLIRRAAVENNITMFTSLDTIKVLIDVLEDMTINVSTIDN
jgi:carbamoyl-phosphate synthase large subunit